MQTIEEILKKIESGSILEVLNQGVELKSKWSQEYGQDICALANVDDQSTNYLIVGINNKGEVAGHDHHWLNSTEQQVANHIMAYLSTTWAAKVSGHVTSKGHILIVEIKNPGDVVEWNNRAYKLIGTSSREMSPDEALTLSLKLPGQDFSKQAWTGEVVASLVVEFAKKIKAKESGALPDDLSSVSPNQILQKLNTSDRMAANILFGSCTVRVVFYDQAGDVISQTSKQGAFYLLSDEFVQQLQTWTKTKGTVLQGSAINVTEDWPYPPKALRETLANAVAHALYERDLGDIVIDIHPNRLVVRNNCLLESKAFAKQWFSKQTHSRNKFLMRLLREAGVTDELGSGKLRLFAQMIEHGKREPIIEFYEKGKFGCWAVTLYNEEQNKTSLTLLERFKQNFNTTDEARIAMALVLWGNNKWSDILERLDEHYKKMAVTVIRDPNSPVIVVNDSILTKRWVNAILAGQDSLAFTAAEEEQIKAVLEKQAFSNDRNGVFSNEEARQLIGLSTSRSEVTQLSNLFRRWREQNIIRQGKRGHWIFQNKATSPNEIIMAILEHYTKQNTPKSKP